MDINPNGTSDEFYLYKQFDQVALKLASN